ncbi:MAG: desulfoferrodoxin [Planctomycetaceae bacterium]|jgi:superoxide reductase|nr:desulfoferrodoxin [Planctomycetaceae bacterium]
MTKISEIYVCELCGNVVEVVANGGGKLVCCGKEMTLKTENTVDAAKEKHVPVVTVDGNTATVQIGSVAHPMEDTHYITWIEIQQGDKFQRVQLKPNIEPKAVFKIDKDLPVIAREYCNKHGLWKN